MVVCRPLTLGQGLQRPENNLADFALGFNILGLHLALFEDRADEVFGEEG